MRSKVFWEILKKCLTIAINRDTIRVQTKTQGDTTVYVLTIEYRHSYEPRLTCAYEDKFETLEEAEKAKAFFIEEREGNGDIIISEDIEQF